MAAITTIYPTSDEIPLDISYTLISGEIMTSQRNAPARAARAKCRRTKPRRAGLGLVLKCENPEEFNKLRDDYIATCQPVNAGEAALVDHMVAARWRIQRLQRMETSLINREMA